jgi:sarcosine oxidase, subunit gamma
MSDNSTIAVMDQYAGDNIPAHTPLQHVGLAELASATAHRTAGIELQEMPVTGQLILRVRGDLNAASEAIHGVLGAGLPSELQFNEATTDTGRILIAWLSPDEWRIHCDLSAAYQLEESLRRALANVPNTSFAVVNASGGFTVLSLAGADVVSLLKKSTGYDVRDSNFPVRKVVGTTFAKATVTLLKTADNQWQIWVRRSFADYVWLWLQDASREYGLKILNTD